MAQAASLAPKHNEGDINTEDDADDPDGKQAGLICPNWVEVLLADIHSVGLANKSCDSLTCFTLD